MAITISVFENSPDEGEGHARDMRVRWALEEVGYPYLVRLLSMIELKEPANRMRHPFGKIPTYEEGGLTLFESGAIVFHIAERHPGLLPGNADARARAISWMFAALTTVEPPIVQREEAMILQKEANWYAERQRILDDRARERLSELETHMKQREWLENEFSAGDLLMITVLRRLEWSNSPDGPQLLDEFPCIAAYVARGKERPAFRRAFAAQKAVFEASQGAPQGSLQS